jgi:hypothetical protein
LERLELPADERNTVTGCLRPQKQRRRMAADKARPLGCFLPPHAQASRAFCSLRQAATCRVLPSRIRAGKWLASTAVTLLRSASAVADGGELLGEAAAEGRHECEEA